MGEENKKGKYDLYTEHIVPDKLKKPRKVLKYFLKVAGTAAIFGIIAGFFMIAIYRESQKLDGGKAAKNDTDLTDSSTSQVTIGNNETKPANTQETTAATADSTRDSVVYFHTALNNIVTSINRSSVVIHNMESKWTSIVSGENGYGVIVGSDNKNFYILTQKESVGNYDNVTVEYSNNTEHDGTVIAIDSVTGMAVVKVEKPNGTNIAAVKLNVNNKVAQGDAVVAVGNLYDTGSAMGYGVVTANANMVTDTDTEFSIINTSINGSDKAFGVLCDISGNVVGIVTGNYSQTYNNALCAYTLSEVYDEIETLINGTTRAYFGIKGLTATDNVREYYQIPKGAYVASVEVNSPAYTAGLQTGDVIYEMGGSKIENMEDFMAYMTKLSAGDEITIKVKRKSRDGYKEIVFNATLGVE